MRSSWLKYILFFSCEFCRNFQEILNQSRQNLTTEILFFLKKEDYSWKYLSHLLLTSYFILVCLNENYWQLLILFLHDQQELTSSQANSISEYSGESVTDLLKRSDWLAEKVWLTYWQSLAASQSVKDGGDTLEKGW